MSYVKDPIYGNHLGIVVNDASFDPEQRGRVQVWIPYLTNTLHAGWNDQLENKEFKHVHDSGALTPALLEELKNVLPWAECAGPIMGGGTAATYNPATGITDTNAHRTFSPSTGTEKGAYIQGNIGPTSTGAHFDIKSVAGNPVKYPNKGSTLSGRPYFERTDLDNFVSVNGVPLSDGRTGKNSQFFSDRPGRPSGHGGYDYAFGTAGDSSDDNKYALTLSNGAKWVNNSSTRSVGDKAVFELPDGSRYEILHGKFDANYNNDQITQTAADTAEIAGTTVNPAKKATESDFTPQDISSSNNVSAAEKSLARTIPTTGYSIGKSYGGTDETEDSGTGRGVGSFENELRPGVVAVNPSVYPIGTIFKNTDTGNVYIAADKHGNTNPNVVDIYYTPSQYKQLKQQGSLNIPANLAVVGKVDQKDIPRTSEGLRGFLSQYGNVPEGEGSYEFLANIKNGNFIDSPMVNPIPNFNPPVIPAGLAGAQPSGFISTPKIGAKVFVFFLAGDIQKPVYFAGLLEKESYQKAQSVASPQTNNIDSEKENNTLGLYSKGNNFTLVEKNKNENGVPTEHGGFLVSSQSGALIDGKAGVNVFAPDALNLHSSGETHRSSMSSSENVQLSLNTNAGDYNLNIGCDANQIKAQEKINNTLKEVQNEKVQEIEKTAKSGEKVPCPLCSTSYAVDRASGFAKRVYNLLRRFLPPYFSYSIDVVYFLVKLILIPFCSIVPGRVLGKCGNSDCENGMIPSPQKPIENANKKAAQKLKSKQKEISDLEKQLGSGGCYSVTALKDVVISAGAVMNDADCYAKTVNKSVPCKGQIGDKSKTPIIQGSSDNLKNTPYTSPLQYPGGNILLKGGNAVKIIAGSPGIELNTKGKITLNCGSLEVIGTDGELVLGSKNHTTLKGHTVTIDANNRTNDGGVEINAPHMICKGFTATGDIGIKGGARIEGELSIPYLNTVSQRMQADQGMSPDQRIPFATWAVGPAQTNDAANTFRLALTHYIMPGALLVLANIIKFVMQIMNTILTNVILEPTITGIYYGACLNAAGPGISWGFVQNFAHNHFEDPKPHHHDYIIPKGTYYDDIAGVNNSAVAPNPIPTRARKHGMGPEGGPKSLAGCGGFGGWGGGSGGKRGKYNKLNSFGISDVVKPFTGTNLNNNNLKFKYKPDGTIKVELDDTPCP